MRDDTSIFPLFLNTNQKKIINPLLMFGLVGMGVGGQLAWKNQDRYEQYIQTSTLAPKIYTWRKSWWFAHTFILLSQSVPRYQWEIIII